MINVPVLPYSSGHLVGGVLLAIALGPGLGALTMAVVLSLQAFLLGDGGLAALGANILNMALVPAGIVALGRRWQGEQTSSLHAGLQAMLAVLLAAALIVLEVAVGRTHGEHSIAAFASQMFQSHLVIGLAEGLLTAGVIFAASRLPVTQRWHVTVAGVAAALLLVALVPLSSPLPDGYEASAARSGWNALLVEGAESLPGALNETLASVQLQMVERVAASLPSEWLVAFVATGLAGALCAVVAAASARVARTA
jgi:cobalt/nickel transport system permease protein